MDEGESAGHRWVMPPLASPCWVGVEAGGRPLPEDQFPATSFITVSVAHRDGRTARVRRSSLPRVEGHCRSFLPGEETGYRWGHKAWS